MYYCPGKHVNIKAPANSGTNFFNYKKTFSVVLLAVCDAKSRFTYVNIGAYGSQSDGGVFKKSKLGIMLEGQQIELPDPMPLNGAMVSYHLLGDAAFPLRPYMMTPYGGRDIGIDKTHHNLELSRGRCSIENAFGILCARWRVFLTTMAVNPEHADSIIMAAALLHNYAMTEGDGLYANQNFVDHYSEGIMVEGEWRRIISNSSNQALQNIPSHLRLGPRNAASETNAKRDFIKQYVCNLPH